MRSEAALARKASLWELIPAEISFALSFDLEGGSLGMLAAAAAASLAAVIVVTPSTSTRRARSIKLDAVASAFFRDVQIHTARDPITTAAANIKDENKYCLSLSDHDDAVAGFAQLIDAQLLASPEERGGGLD